MDILEAWEVERDGVTYRVQLLHDNESSPKDYTTRDEEPELFRSWEAAEWQYVGVVVAPTYEADSALYELDELAASVWAVEYGDVAGIVVDRRYLNEEKGFVPDLIAECLTKVKKAAPALRALLAASESL